MVCVPCIVGIEEKLLFSIYDNLNEKDLDTGVVRTLVSGIQVVYSMVYDHKKKNKCMFQIIVTGIYKGTFIICQFLSIRL